jgi:sugar-specific transcriptional regulator TrmB
MPYNADLFNVTQFRKLIEQLGDVDNYFGEIRDALADYESAAELAGEERTEARSEARDAAWNTLNEALTTLPGLLAALTELRDKLEAEQ